MSANRSFETLPFPPTGEFEAFDGEDEFEVIRRPPAPVARVHAVARGWPGPLVRDHRRIGNTGIGPQSTWRQGIGPQGTWRPGTWPQGVGLQGTWRPGTWRPGTWQGAQAPWRPAYYFPRPDDAPAPYYDPTIPAPYVDGGASPDSDRVRWVQDALNRLLGLNLTVDGIVRPALRDAVRAFQQRAGLRATGRVGPATQRALSATVSAASQAAPAADQSPPAASPGEPTGEAEDYYEHEGYYEGEDEGYYEGEDEGYYEGEDESYYEGEDEFETPRAAAAFRFVKDFSGPAAECTAALRRAGKTKVQALTIINDQIAVAIRLLRKAAADLERGKRSAATSKLFLDIFRVRPEFVPSWFKPTPTVQDRGDVVATRCLRVADLLASGSIRLFCAITPTNCPDCKEIDTSPRKFACSSWGDDSVAPKGHRLVICLGNGFWDDMKNGRTNSILATLMHEPFHLYFGLYVTEHHRPTTGKFGGVRCILRFVFETNGMAAEDRDVRGCRDMPVRR